MSAASLQAYGQRNFGLGWTLQEAISSGDTWSQLYPKIRLWRFWTAYLKTKVAKDNLPYDTMKNVLLLELPGEALSYDCGSERPLAVFGKLTRALGYQGQGTGTDIFTRVISRLPPAVGKLLVRLLRGKI